MTRGLAIMLMSAAVFAAATQEVRLKTSERLVRVGEPFTLIVEIEGDPPDNVRIPDADGIEIDPRSRGTNSVISMRNGQATRVVSWLYAAHATEEGDIVIPPFVAKYGRRLVETNPVTISVRSAPAEPRELTWDDVVRWKARASKDEVYVGEPLVYRGIEMLWEHADVYRGAELKFPDTTGFYAVPAQPERAGRDQIIDNDLEYNTTEYIQILFPTQEGSVEIGPSHWIAMVNVAPPGRRSARQTCERASNSVKVQVKPLPEAPGGFSGAVGQFALRAEAISDRVVSGTPVKLTLWVSGSGNPNALGAPTIPDMPWAMVQGPEKDARAELTEDGLHVQQQYVYEIVPLEPGEREIPPIAYTFFDPDREEFVTQTVGPFPIEVVVAAGTQHVIIGAGGEDENKAVGGQDILPIIQAADGLHRPKSLRVVVPVVVVAPGLAYAVFAIVLARRRRFDRDRAYSRAYHARSKGRKRLSHVLDADDPAEALYRALVGYVCDKLDEAEAGMTSADIEKVLRSRGIDDAIANGFTTILRRSERARYAGATLSEDEMRALAHGAAKQIDDLDAVMKNGGKR